MNKVCLIEFNEANFDLVQKYVKDYKLPNLQKILSMRRVITSSETEYTKLEPWIQWASVHTCSSQEEHGVFRLGDIQNYQGDQIFEIIEGRGYKVGVISAMNAKNSLSKPSYFIPDPWTSTISDNSNHSRQIHSAIKQVVNDNSSGKISKRS